MQQPLSSPNRSFLAHIFISSAENRLRAGWRLLIQAFGQVVLTLCLSPLIIIPFGLMSGSFDVSGLPFLGLSEILELFTVTVSVFLARRFLDKRSIPSLGLDFRLSTLVDLLAGILITFIMMGGIFLVGRGLGWITFQGFAWQSNPIPTVFSSVVLSFLVFLVVAWNEELMSRGYHLQTITNGTNLFWGITLSSLIFGLLHLGNPNATWFSAAGIFFAGLFFALAYIWTKGLWLPIGLHLGWNFFEGVVFGFPVSGLNINTLSHITVSGPILWMGGAFGPEAGLIVLPALVLGSILLYGFSLARNKFGIATFSKP